MSVFEEQLLALPGSAKKEGGVRRECILIFPGGGKEKLTGQRIVKVPEAKAFPCTVYTTSSLISFCTPSMISLCTSFLTPPNHYPGLVYTVPEGAI